MSSITRFIPKNHLSYAVGKLVHIELPRFLSKLMIVLFAKSYGINLKEAEKPVEDYPSLGEFFVRRLKAGVRPIGSAWALHPADSMVTQAAPIQKGRLIQAKNKTYSLESFTQDPQALKKYGSGFFVTYYLCPTDYHRVHSPVSGRIVRAVHIPGALWPVNSWSTDNIHELFSVNERMLVEIETDRGLVGLMFVGATNVGQIVLSFDPDMIGNQLLSSAPREKTYHVEIKKGEEIGMFRMGSTVVMLYSQQPANETLQKLHNQSVKVNSDFFN